ncbi:MAG: type I-C CRISPR-associated protein Cas8c/Csd1, partial [Oscillospiraceae bacterium]|nr:type I-C CRISPR-associated protein Cas8c/Csd1 [Oscillospiraceae bacterium]
MILQALASYYEALKQKGKISPPGWSAAKVTFALLLAEDGTLQGIQGLKYLPEGAKREVPQVMDVPEQVKKTSGVASNFLCENSSYFLGIDAKGKPERSRQCFEAARALHKTLLAGVDSPAARAVTAFFDTWSVEDAAQHPVIAPLYDELTAGANLIFSVDGVYAQNDAAIAEKWEKSKTESGGAREEICLVTGERAPIARLHASIKGVKGAQSSGAALVSFNVAALESYGKEMSDDTGQGYNAPVSEKAAFAYTTALNYLLADRKHVQHIGDTTVVYWAEDADERAQDVFGFSLFGPSSDDVITDDDLEGVLKAMAQGGPLYLKGLPLKPQNKFYVLGLAPNAARLSVRFFLQDTFGGMLQHIQRHYDALKIIKPAYEKFELLPLWRLLNETVNQKSKDKSASPPMAGAVLRSILTGDDYPASLFENVMLRIRAEQEITYGRASILKAYFLRNRSIHLPEEVLEVQLNEETTYMPYVLGRLFSVYVEIQEAANPGINTTIKDKYFNSAAATPGVIFPVLIALAEKHLKKLEKGRKTHYEIMLVNLWGRFEEDLPKRMAVEDQGTFYLG